MMLPSKAGTSPDCGQENESLKRFVWKVVSGSEMFPFLVVSRERMTLDALQAWDAFVVPQPETLWGRLLSPGMEDPTTDTVTLPCLNASDGSAVESGSDEDSDKRLGVRTG